MLRDSAAAEGDGDHFAAGDGVAFADGVGDYEGFAEAGADGALAVADYHEGVEPEAASAFDDFGDAAGVDHALGETAGVLLAGGAFTAGGASVAGAAAAAASIAGAVTAAASSRPVLSWGAGAAAPAWSAASAWWGLYHWGLRPPYS